MTKKYLDNCGASSPSTLRAVVPADNKHAGVGCFEADEDSIDEGKSKIILEKY